MSVFDCSILMFLIFTGFLFNKAVEYVFKEIRDIRSRLLLLEEKSDYCVKYREETLKKQHLEGK